MKKVIILISSTFILSIIGLAIFFRIVIGCGGHIVCHATEDYPPSCDEKGETFILLKNKNMSFSGNPIPDNAFYYLLPEGMVLRNN